MEATRVSTKGGIVIPKEIRDRYGIEPGASVRIVDYAGTLIIVPEREISLE